MEAPGLPPQESSGGVQADGAVDQDLGIERDGERLWKNLIDGCRTPPRLQKRRKLWLEGFNKRREEEEWRQAQSEVGKHYSEYSKVSDVAVDLCIMGVRRGLWYDDVMMVSLGDSWLMLLRLLNSYYYYFYYYYYYYYYYCYYDDDDDDDDYDHHHHHHCHQLPLLILKVEKNWVRLVITSYDPQLKKWSCVADDFSDDMIDLKTAKVRNIAFHVTLSRMKMAEMGVVMIVINFGSR